MYTRKLTRITISPWGTFPRVPVRRRDSWCLNWLAFLWPFRRGGPHPARSTFIKFNKASVQLAPSVLRQLCRRNVHSLARANSFVDSVASGDQNRVHQRFRVKRNEHNEVQRPCCPDRVFFCTISGAPRSGTSLLHSGIQSRQGMECDRCADKGRLGQSAHGNVDRCEGREDRPSR